MSTGDTTRHIAMGDLVRLLHGEIEGAERDFIVAHLETCCRCQERRSDLESGFEEFGSSLGLMPAPELAPERRAQAWAAIQRSQLQVRKTSPVRSWNRAIRAAAVITVMVTAAFTVEPVRAWVTQTWHAVTGEPAMAVLEGAANPIRVRNAIVGFVPSSAEFLLEIRNRQELGTLTIVLSDEATSASAKLSGPDEVDVVVLPGGFRVENGAAARNDYEVTIPATVERIAVRIGDARTVRFNTADHALPSQTVFDLGTGTAAPTNTTTYP